MRRESIRRARPRRAVTLAVALSALCLAAPAAAAPVNDNYESSLALNAPGAALNRTDTLRDLRDTTGATLQSDIFSPPNAGGPAEISTCQGTRYASTVWYDFYPDIDGIARIRTSGFNNVISLIPFDRNTLQPDFGARQCVVNIADASQELIASVKAGQAYTVQIGGVNDAQGMLEFLFDFLPQIKRVVAGATLTARPSGGGVQVVKLNVQTPRGTRVEVRCSRGCRRIARSASTLSFPGLKGARLPAGSRLMIYVTAPHAIGAFIEYKIGQGTFSKLDRCLNPGSRVPRLRCG